MPYADPEMQRKAARESAARRRALAHVRVNEPEHSPPQEPVPSHPPQVQHAAVEPITEADLINAGLALSLKPLSGEGYAQFRARLRQRWQTILRVVEDHNG